MAWKPAFGGKLIIEILCSSTVQMATIRAGVLPTRTPRSFLTPEVVTLDIDRVSRVRVLKKEREDDSEELASTPVVIGVGQGVKPTTDTLNTLRGASAARCTAHAQGDRQGLDAPGTPGGHHRALDHAKAVHLRRGVGQVQPHRRRAQRGT